MACARDGRARSSCACRAVSGNMSEGAWCKWQHITMSRVIVTAAESAGFEPLPPLTAQVKTEALRRAPVRSTKKLALPRRGMVSGSSVEIPPA